MSDSLFKPAQEWAMKRGLDGIIVGDALILTCPACGTGALRIHTHKLFWFCFGNPHCWKCGEGEKSLTALFTSYPTISQTNT